ncbi:uncharacterized protein LOC134249052 isoform X1 [Saccostrea cucullata]|uniref:uncharacterized protein LOC134249052 isoform X1 n=1 Tax=Saccostrea cuccullata TaxID=36930 RepID=UPI002ED0A2A7
MITLRLFLLFTGTLVKIIINADNKERTWSDANSECNLLGSHESGIFSEISAIYQDQVPTDGKMYWIAAIKKTTIPFRFNKCRSSVDVNTGIFNIQGTRRPVYDCFNNCSGDFFALSSSKCACTLISIGKTEVCNYKLFEGTKMDFYSESNYLEYRKGSVQGMSYS